LQSGKLPETPAFLKGNRKFIDRPKKAFKPTLEQQDGKIRLNKYIANAGICSRREADDLIKSGVIKVNGKVVDELGFRVSPSDKIQYGDQTLSKEVKRYLLLNKPKDYITTATDPDGRKTVMELVKSMCKERLYPVGRLDRNTTGLLLMTNDGELAKKLTHPSHQVKKIYQVTLDKNLKALDLKKISEGLTLEDGLAEVDEVAYVGEGNDKSEIGIALHSGKNRIVRRIFEHLGYEVVKLDRTYFAGLTKKDLPRGKSRLLTEKELIMLRMS
jgi:23S rRNA pseudouridine2605 synthase